MDIYHNPTSVKEEHACYMYVWYGMVDVYDGYLAAEASRSS